MGCICGKYEKQDGSELCKNCWQKPDKLQGLMSMFGMK